MRNSSLVVFAGVVAAAIFAIALSLSGDPAKMGHSRSAKSGNTSQNETDSVCQLASKPVPKPYEKIRQSDTTVKLLAIEEQTSCNGISDFLKDSSSQVRVKAAYQLWKLGTPEALEKLQKLRNDPDNKVRTFVTIALSSKNSGGVK